MRNCRPEEPYLPVVGSDLDDADLRRAEGQVVDDGRVAEEAEEQAQEEND